MKILQVRFQNLNSLVGEWTIDLRQPVFETDGIFAITGPTGSGKTTILDAICLALYGRTPRLPRITKSGNEIMSRLTGECFAEVVFASQKGQYCCHWSQHRARRRPDGELQAPRHEISSAATGELLESSLRAVSGIVEDVTGMDFERFTRSMMLAQGDFAVFLQADPDERAPILEQITGTGIYSQISMLVHERKRLEQEQLEKLRLEMQTIQVLAPELVRELEAELAGLLEQKTKHENLLKQLGCDIVWLTGIEKLQEELEKLSTEEDKLRLEQEDFAPQAARLERALRAATVEGRYELLSGLRKDLAREHQNLAEEEKKRPPLEQAIVDIRAIRDQAQIAREATLQEQENAAPLLLQVRKLDQRLKTLAGELQQSQADCRKTKQQIEQEEKTLAGQQNARIEAEQKLAGVEQYLSDNGRDQWLIGGLTGIEELLAAQGQLRHKGAALEKTGQAAAGALKKKQRELEKTEKLIGALREGLAEVSTKIEAERLSLKELLGDRLLREYRTDKEALLREMNLRQRIASLEEERQRLADGLPCPLCGATEHPFAAGNIPAVEESERKIAALDAVIGKAEALEAAIAGLEQQAKTAQEKIAQVEKQELSVGAELKQAQQALADAQQALLELQADIERQQQTIVQRLTSLELGDTAGLAPDQLLKMLQARLKSWNEQSLRKVELEKALAGLTSGIERLVAVIDTLKKNLTEKETVLKQRQDESVLLAQERQQIFGDRVADDVERALKNKTAEAVKAVEQATAQSQQADIALKANEVQIAECGKRIDLLQPDLAQMESQVRELLTRADFADESEYKAASLPATELNELRQTAESLQKRRADMQTRREDRTERLERERELQLTSRGKQELEAELAAGEAAARETVDQIAKIHHNLEGNRRALQQIEARQKALEAQQQEWLRWDALHDLIGSADGKKFRNFAQGLTFEIMISHANRELQKLNDRYLLIQEVARPLELSVIDNYQAGEVRSTKNLSGGESFLVSLALALGLSHMSSRRVRVDSLFLDEGFGTLDQEALDAALGSLGSLRQEGKLIGIISHVAALQDRIATRIQIQPRSGGRSTISGPGCTGP